MADWTKADGYPAGSNVSLSQWAWEFLRRNPAYQSEWKEYAAAVRKVIPGWEFGANLSDCECQLLENAVSLNHYDPARLPGESDAAWGRKCKTGVVIPLDIWLGGQWGIDRILPPSLAYSSCCGPRFLNNPYCIKEIKEPHQLEGLAESQVALIFDLNKPIRQQLRTAGRLLSARKEKATEGNAKSAKRAMCDKYPGYLRVLDAIACDKSLADIANILLPNIDNTPPDYLANKTIKNWEKAANALINKDGYRTLLEVGPVARRSRASVTK